jgi:hypothetical protein
VFELLIVSDYTNRMKQVGKMAVCLAAALMLQAAARADDAALSGNPYASIVARNVFGLNPPAPVDQTQIEAPVKIMPNGIMSIFGRLQVLFKATTPPKPGQPSKDEFYTLAEGQRQDDIEVTHIDEKSAIVTFNNHGVIQQLPLTKAPALTISVPPAAPPAAPTPFQNFRPNWRRSNNGGNQGFNNGGDVSSASSADSNLRTVPSRGGYSISPQPQNSVSGLSFDDQQAIIAANHAQAVSAGSPTAALFPPTKYDQAAGLPPPPVPGQSSQ